MCTVYCNHCVQIVLKTNFPVTNGGNSETKTILGFVSALNQAVHESLLMVTNIKEGEAVGALTVFSTAHMENNLKVPGILLLLSLACSCCPT